MTRKSRISSRSSLPNRSNDFADLHIPRALERGINSVATDLAGLRSGENVIVLSDLSIDRDLSLSFAKVIDALGGIVTEICCRCPTIIGQELPRPIQSALIGGDVVIILSWWHPAVLKTSAVWRAVNEFEVRLVHIDPPHRKTLSSESVSGDYSRIRKIAHALYSRLIRGRTLKVTSTGGTDFQCQIDPKEFNYSDEFPISAGVTVSPPGFCDFKPVANSSNGVIVFDELDKFKGHITPLRCTIRNDQVTELMGGFEARWMKQAFREYPNANYLTDVGIGVNPYVQVEQLLSEPFHEAVHRAAGLFITGIGRSPTRHKLGFHSHQGVLRPTVTVVETNDVLVKDGRLRLKF